MPEDPDVILSVPEASYSDLQLMRKHAKYGRYVRYSLLLITVLCLFGSAAVALAFAYLKLYENADID